MNTIGNTSQDKFYKINYVDYEQFFPGVSKDQRQVLMGLLYPNLTALFFSSDGNLIEAEDRELRTLDNSLDPDNPDFREKALRILTMWQNEIGFSPATIRIRCFNVRGIRIEDRPSHYEEFLRNPEAYEPDEQERASMSSFVKRWEQENRFVLFWGKDYWMNQDGTIHST